MTKTKPKQTILCELESGKTSILSHFWFPFRNFRCGVIFTASCAHPLYTISYQLHKISSVRSDAALGMSNMFEASLGVVTAVFNSVLYGVTIYSFHVPTKQSTALKSGRCGHHTVGPPVDRMCWNVGADHHAQTTYLLSPLMKHHPTTHANHFLMSMTASSLCCKIWVPIRNTAKNVGRTRQLSTPNDNMNLLWLQVITEKSNYTIPGEACFVYKQN